MADREVAAPVAKRAKRGENGDDDDAERAKTVAQSAGQDAGKVVEELDWTTPEFRKVTVRVPATTANMGPGFDCLGMALDLWSELTVEHAEDFSITYEGEGVGQVPLDETNLVVIALIKAFETAGKPVPKLRYHCVSRIPFARGLGSSSAAIVAGLIAGLVLAGHRLPVKNAEDLLQLAANIEGHPDNVAPAIYGGIQLGIHDGERWASENVPCPPGLQCIMFIPNMIGKTSDARAVLPEKIDRKDAIFNIGRVAWLINALSTNNLHNLRSGCEDRLHQPQRGEAVYRHLFPLIKASRSAGAKATWLSGAGPTVMAITSGRHGDVFAQQLEERGDRRVAAAMADAARSVDVDGSVSVTAPTVNGAHVSDVELLHPGDAAGDQRMRHSLVRNLSDGALHQIFL